MKRGKDDEKLTGPMFRRLHVNDTEKGGPRAPPRNKMALYEQLSVPSHRFNPGVLPHNPNSNSSTVQPASSSQVIIRFRVFAPVPWPPFVKLTLAARLFGVLQMSFPVLLYLCALPLFSESCYLSCSIPGWLKLG